MSVFTRTLWSIFSKHDQTDCVKRFDAFVCVYILYVIRNVVVMVQVRIRRTLPLALVICQLTTGQRKKKITTLFHIDFKRLFSKVSNTNSWKYHFVLTDNRLGQKQHLYGRCTGYDTYYFYLTNLIYNRRLLFIKLVINNEKNWIAVSTIVITTLNTNVIMTG